MSALNKKNESFFTDGQEVKILTFSIDQNSKSLLLALNIQKIKEVVEQESLSDLPDSYEPFIGVYNLRDMPVPVIDLNYFFRSDNSERNSSPIKNGKIIICEFQKIFVGLLVSEVGKISTFLNEQVDPVPDALKFTHRRLFNGVIKLNKEFIHLLDIELILDSLEIDLGSKTRASSPHKLYEGMSVLIVEDSHLFQKKLSQFFRKLGMKIHMAENGLQGLEKLEELDHQVDLVFTDIEMPKLNGIGMVKKILQKPEGKKLPIIFNTSISNPALIKDIQDEKLGTPLVKFDEESILKTMGEILPPKKSKKDSA